MNAIGQHGRPLNGERLYVVEDRVAVRSIGGEMLLVPVCGSVGDLDSIYVLSDVGSAVWAGLSQPTSLTAIVESIAREYEVSRDDAAADVSAFISELSVRKLVKVLEPD
jgi:hypothetical protein